MFHYYLEHLQLIKVIFVKTLNSDKIYIFHNFCSSKSVSVHSDVIFALQKFYLPRHREFNQIFFPVTNVTSSPYEDTILI